ncbi:hypothetical protein ADL00_25135 [Streptomyces sp. AS58]|nr:hypothetical protein ADL00_25135 [Streptomyces sp. AS58]
MRAQPPPARPQSPPPPADREPTLPAHRRTVGHPCRPTPDDPRTYRQTRPVDHFRSDALQLGQILRVTGHADMPCPMNGQRAVQFGRAPGVVQTGAQSRGVHAAK